MLRAVICSIALAACRATPPATPVVQPARAARWSELAGRYDAARKAHDDAAAERVLDEIDTVVPNNPQIIFAHAKLAAERGDTAAATRWLERYAAAGLVVPPGAPGPLIALCGEARLAARFADNARPHGAARIAFALPTGDKLFEDVVWDAAAHLFYVSSVRDRRVFAVTPAGDVRPLTEPEPDGIGVSGLALAGHVLWQSTAALPLVPGYRDDAPPSGLVALDVTSGRELQRLALPRDGGKHALTDLAVTAGGDVLASDATGGKLYIARRGRIELLAADFMSPQTPALRDATTAYVPDYSLGIARVDLATGAERWLTSDAVLTGIDGLYGDAHGLIAIQNGVQPPRIVRLELAADGNAVTAAHVIASAPELGEPTHAAIVDGTLWFLGNSGWSRFDDTGGIVPDAPADRPALWRVELR